MPLLLRLRRLRCWLADVEGAGIGQTNVNATRGRVRIEPRLRVGLADVDGHDGRCEPSNDVKSAGRAVAVWWAWACSFSAVVNAIVCGWLRCA